MVTKSQLRKAMLAARPHSSAGLTSQLLELIQRLQPRAIASFQPLADEPQLAEFNRLVNSQSELVFPRIAGSDLEFAGGELRSGGFGILEPTGQKVEEIDLLLVPALAVDLQGNRLGRGKGYYDRTLVRFPRAKKFAVVFEEEIVEEVPTDPWDEKLDGIVTPLRTIIFD